MLPKKCWPVVQNGINPHVSNAICAEKDWTALMSAITRMHFTADSATAVNLAPKVMDLVAAPEPYQWISVSIWVIGNAKWQTNRRVPLCNHHLLTKKKKYSKKYLPSMSKSMPFLNEPFLLSPPQYLNKLSLSTLLLYYYS